MRLRIMRYRFDSCFPLPKVTMREIKWTCVANPDWQWLSAQPGKPAGFPVEGDTVRQGTIKLPPNPDYWHPCINLVLQMVSYGNAYLRYFQENGTDKLQAIAVAPDIWTNEGPVHEQFSCTNSTAGFNLYIEFVSD